MDGLAHFAKGKSSDLQPACFPPSPATASKSPQSPRPAPFATRPVAPGSTNPRRPSLPGLDCAPTPHTLLQTHSAGPFPSQRANALQLSGHIIQAHLSFRNPACGARQSHHHHRAPPNRIASHRNTPRRPPTSPSSSSSSAFCDPLSSLDPSSSFYFILTSSSRPPGRAPSMPH